MANIQISSRDHTTEFDVLESGSTKKWPEGFTSPTSAHYRMRDFIIRHNLTLDNVKRKLDSI